MTTLEGSESTIAGLVATRNQLRRGYEFMQVQAEEGEHVADFTLRRLAAEINRIEAILAALGGDSGA